MTKQTWLIGADNLKFAQILPNYLDTIYQYFCLRFIVSFSFLVFILCACDFSSLRLKEEIKTSERKLNSMAVDLRRREDDSSDLREKLCDSKKQIQQVQKEVRTHSVSNVWAKLCQSLYWIWLLLPCAKTPYDLDLLHAGRWEISTNEAQWSRKD